MGKEAIFARIGINPNDEEWQRELEEIKGMSDEELNTEIERIRQYFEDDLQLELGLF